MSEVSWAKELGIDMGDLYAEHPTHGSQVRQAKQAEKASERYWEAERFLAQLFDRPVGSEVPVKIAVKRTRVKNYVFTEAQMRVAERSLNAGGAV